MKETRTRMLNRLREDIASCKRVYKRMDGKFHVIEGYTGTGAKIIREVEVRPACLEPRVLIVNESPANINLEERIIAIDDFMYKLTMNELDYVLPLGIGGDWSKKEAEFFAARMGSIYKYEAYVLGDSHNEVFGDRNGLRTGKMAVGVEYYYIE